MSGWWEANSYFDKKDHIQEGNSSEIYVDIIMNPEKVH